MLLNIIFILLIYTLYYTFINDFSLFLFILLLIFIYIYIYDFILEKFHKIEKIIDKTYKIEELLNKIPIINRL